MQTIQAIPTKYKGVTFRSRLEARWAMFFDLLGIKWFYEFEGYDIPGAGWYVPDFWLPEVGGGTFVEVKPETFNGEDRRIFALSCAIEKPGILVSGPPVSPDGYETAGDFNYSLCECPVCAKIDFVFEGSHRWGRVCRHPGRADDKGWHDSSPEVESKLELFEKKVARAAALANAHRFH
jgi:hypothetical protein